MERILGFKYNPYSTTPFEEYSYFYYSIDLEEPINIGDFQYLVNINSWQENEIEVAELIIRYNRQENILAISKKDEVILQRDIMDFVRDLYEKVESDTNGRKNLVHPIDMIYDISLLGIEENFEFRFIFTNISGRVDEDNNIDLDGAEFILLIGLR